MDFGFEVRIMNIIALPHYGKGLELELWLNCKVITGVLVLGSAAKPFPWTFGPFQSEVGHNFKIHPFEEVNCHTIVCFVSGLKWVVCR